MNLKSKVLHGIKWKAITLVGRQFISLGLMTVLARLVDPASFGLISLSAVYFTFANLFADQGIASALIQREKLDDEHLHTAFWFNISCAGILCLATLIFAHPISLLFKEPRLTLVLQISSLGFLISSVSAVHSALLTRELDFHRAGIRTILGNVTGGVVGSIMA
jgi:PST family polysaccharide transporter